MEGSSSAIGSDVNLVAGSNFPAFVQGGGHTWGRTGFCLQWKEKVVILQSSGYNCSGLLCRLNITAYLCREHTRICCCSSYFQSAGKLTIACNVGVEGLNQFRNMHKVLHHNILRAQIHAVLAVVDIESLH